jgi:hypothetical protein
MSEWTNRLEDNYWSPAQVRLFVDNLWVDDACAVRYQITDNKVPKYGYNNPKFSAVARGTTIVHGRLSINFRYNGYLRSVLLDQIRRRRDLDLLDNQRRSDRIIKHQLTPEILERSSTELLEWASAVAGSQDRDKRDAVFEFLKRSFWSDAPNPEPTMSDQAGGPIADSDEQRKRRDEQQVLQRIGLLTGGFTIIMVFGDDPANVIDPALVKAIQDVYVVGESQVVDIEAPSGARAVREVYNFFARDVQPGKIGRQVSLVGGASS